MGYQLAKRLAITPVQPETSSLQSSNEPPEVLPGARLHRGSEMHRGMQQHAMRKVLVWNRTARVADQ